MEKSKSIVIIDKNMEVRDSLQKLIDSSNRFSVTHTFDSYELALANMGLSTPDIILMGIDFPGFQAIKHIKKRCPQTEIIIVTEQEYSQYVFEALAAGATGFLINNNSQLTLLHALDEVANGGAPMSTSVSRLVVESFHTQSTHDFSAREMEVLKLLSNGKSYKTIAQQLKISFSTVKFHIQNIYRKLQVTNKEEAITKVQTERII
jgi:DNA-binding NarL/FixJ family response regulator